MKALVRLHICAVSTESSLLSYVINPIFVCTDVFCFLACEILEMNRTIYSTSCMLGNIACFFCCLQNISLEGIYLCKIFQKTSDYIQFKPQNRMHGLNIMKCFATRRITLLAIKQISSIFNLDL